MNRRTSALAGLAWLLGAAAPAAALTVAPLQGPTMYVDVSDGLTSAYVGFDVTNNDGFDYADLYVALEFFTGPMIAPAPNEDAQFRVGPLGAGETKPVYFYLSAAGATMGPETFSLRAYEGLPGVGLPVHDELIPLIAEESIAASANKVRLVVSYVDAPIGGTVQVTVVGETGIVGNTGDYNVTPASDPAWPADDLELSGVHLDFRTLDCLTPLFTVDDELHAVLTPGLEYCHEATYTFRVRGDAGATQVSPISYISSGVQIKHSVDDCGGLYLCDLPPPVNTTTVEKQAGPTSLPAGGTTTYSVTFSNAASSGIVLDDAIDVLPVVPAPGTYLTGTATYGGSPIADPIVDGATLTFVGPFVVPASGTGTLSYDVALPSDPGVYMNEAVAAVGALQIDATLGLGDDAPAQASVTVGGVMPGAGPIGVGALATLLALAGVRAARRRRRA